LHSLTTIEPATIGEIPFAIRHSLTKTEIGLPVIAMFRGAAVVWRLQPRILTRMALSDEISMSPPSDALPLSAKMQVSKEISVGTRLDAGGWFARRFRGQRIQTLSEVLERFRDRVAFGIELKAGSDLYPAIEERLLTLLQIYDVLDRTLVTSFDHHALRKCRDLDPEVRTGALVVGRLLAPAALAPAGVLNALCLRADLITVRDVAAAREAGLDCYAWVVDDPAAARRLVEWGVAGIVTDRPDLIRPVLDRAAVAGRASAEGG